MDLFTFSGLNAQNERFFSTFALVILLERGPTVFRYSIKLPHTKKSVINGGCQLTLIEAWALAVFGNITLGCGNPDGIELFIKGASRLFP